MHFRSFLRLTVIVLSLIVFSSSISFLSVQQVAFAKSSNCTQTLGSGIIASAEAKCSSQPVGRLVPKEIPGLSIPGANNSNAHYFHAGGLQDSISDGASGNFNEPWPVLDQNDSHTLAELIVAFREPDNTFQAIGVGWTADRTLNKGDDTPHLFVEYFVDGVWQGYNPSNLNVFRHISGTIAPGDGVVVDRYPNTTHKYVIQFYQGNWWIRYESEWIGYFPGSVWQGRFTQSNITEWYGEVATRQPFPSSQMGNGQYGTTQGVAAVMNNMYLIVNGKGYYAHEQELPSTSHFYNVGNFTRDSFSYGGPGHLASSYQGTAHNSTYNIDAGLTLSSITEDSQGNISGIVTWGSPLVGNGPFTGTLSANNSVTFTEVSNDGSGFTDTFTGTINSDGSLSGNYSSEGSGAPQQGTWQVSST